MNHTDIAVNEFNDRMAVKVNELPPTLPKSFFKEHKFSFADSYDVRCRYTSRIGWFILTTEVKEVLVNFLKGKSVLEVGSGTSPVSFTIVNQYLTFNHLFNNLMSKRFIIRWPVHYNHVITTINVI